MTDKRARTLQAFDGLLAGPQGVLGAALVSRDGLPVLSKFKRPVDEETFSAMVAALMGAGEAALQELGLEKPKSATIESGVIRMAVAGLDADYLFVLAAPATLAPTAFQALVDASAAEMRKILAG